MRHDEHDFLRPLVAGALLFSIGPAGMMVMPMIVGVYVDELGFSGRQAGLLASVEATGMCVASLLGLVWVRTLNWRLATLLGLGCALAANLLAAGVHQFAPMLACRALASLGAGTAFAAATASLAEQRKPETAFGIGLAVQTLLTTMMMALSAGIIEWQGIAGIFRMLALLAFVVALPVGWLPVRSAKSAPVGEPAPRPGSTDGASIVAGLIGTMLFYAGLLGFWVYLERIGHAAGHSNALIGTILAWSLAAGVLGGIGPVWISGRVGIARPILLTVLILIATVLIAVGKVTLPVFALSAIVFGAMWVLATAYQAALIATLDRHGRYVVLVPAAQGAGAMIGPAAASLLIQGDEYLAVNLIAVAFFAGSLILFRVAMRGLGTPGPVALSSNQQLE
ncbi:MAG: MFS transporter [Gammaproteobacteria bacterium]|nr:MAG: MFS transporter [Gammaproteobacteria bacterium]